MEQPRLATIRYDQARALLGALETLGPLGLPVARQLQVADWIIIVRGEMAKAAVVGANLQAQYGERVRRDSPQAADAQRAVDELAATTFDLPGTLSRAEIVAAAERYEVRRGEPPENLSNAIAELAPLLVPE